MSVEGQVTDLDRQVTEVVATMLDVAAEGLTGGTPLAAIAGWDSVNALRVLAYLERSVGATLDYAHFHAASTIADLTAVVAQATGAGVRGDG